MRIMVCHPTYGKNQDEPSSGSSALSVLSFDGLLCYGSKGERLCQNDLFFEMENLSIGVLFMKERLGV